MTKPEFDAFVKRQQSKQQDETFDPQQQLEEWLRYLDVLYKQCTRFLESYIQNNSARIEYRDIRLNEEFSGPYTAQEMLLRIGHSAITFTPIGTMLIGMKGRVDVQGPLGISRLALVNKDVTSPRQLIQVTLIVPGHGSPVRPSREATNKIDWAWKIMMPPPEMKFIDLVQETFFDMILSVADA